MDYTGGSPDADHLVVLVHGLWGNPNHMKSMAKALRSAPFQNQLYILVVRKNSGSFTYDGIERGGERVCAEIEEELRRIEERGGRINKISIVGYSLGGIVARYAVGVLFARGLFDRYEPMNFTAFASPHLGVRTPLRGWHNHIWNVLGARTLSMSGRQLFTIDNFRETGRPLLSILADPKATFLAGLAKFKRRTLYCNVVNDLSTVYYTSGIDKRDPYKHPTNLKANFLPGYGDVILDPDNPATPLVAKSEPVTVASITNTAWRYMRRLPLVLSLAVFIPVGVVLHLAISVVQNFRSSRRIAQHEKGLAGIRVEDYRLPIWLREAVEDAYEHINSSQSQHYLTAADDSDAGLDEEDQKVMSFQRRESRAEFPTLALTAEQLKMIEALDRVGWHKYHVWIHKHRHSHAAIIVRIEKESHSEGRMVLSHWLNEEFIP